MSFFYEVVQYDENLPAKLLVQHKPAYRCHSHLHWHKEVEIVYMVRGELDVNLGGKTVKIKDGDLYLSNSEEIHETNTPEYIDTNYYIVILLSYDFIKKFYNKLDNFKFVADKDSKEQLTRIIKQIIPLVENKPLYYQLTLNIKIIELCKILLSKCLSEKENVTFQNTPNIGYAKKAINYIEENYKKEITLDDISSYIGLTPTYFSNYFKKATNCTFMYFLQGIRLENALKDMIYNDSSVKEASINNGFANIKSFIVQCKKVYGCTPNEYKNKIKNE